MVNSLNAIVKSKVEQELIAVNIKNNSTNNVEKQFAEAIRLSNHIMAEDIIREAGYMLPQSDNALAVLRELLANTTDPKFPMGAVKQLIETFEK